jgi:DNA-binding response OmpR family regulator
VASVLVVDDMPMHLDYLKEELTRIGHEVATADNGAEGLRRITRSRPDIVLLDMSMPVMDGLEVLRALRADPAYEGLPVILLTARKEFEDRVQGLDAGADDYITKPFHIGEVAARIKALLRIHELQRRVVEREKRVGHLEGVAQTMVTLAHHINNATQSVAGIAQLCSEAPGNDRLREQLVEISIRQCRKITAVLTSLQQAVERAHVPSASYAGQADRMLDIEEDLRRRLESLDRPEGSRET